MNFVFDLDGVLRDINGYLVGRYYSEYPTKWDWKYRGMNFFEAVANDDYRALLHASITPYLLTAERLLRSVEIWTAQPKHWRAFTEMWIRQNIKSYTLRYLNTEEKREALDEEPDTILIEDCPLFKNYDRIVLIDYPYNNHIECERIRDEGDLEELILDMD